MYVRVSAYEYSYMVPMKASVTQLRGFSYTMSYQLNAETLLTRFTDENRQQKMKNDLFSSRVLGSYRPMTRHV